MAYFIDERTIEEIKDRAEIATVISDYIDLKKTGANYKGLCPFHGEKTPSFTVSNQKGIYKCFGCGEGGNVINFVMKMENISFPEACKKLADQYGIKIESKGNYDEEYQNTLKQMRDINKNLAIFYMKNLPKSKKALNYLMNRNIKKESIIKFGIGYGNDSWDDAVNFLKSMNFDLELAHKAGAIGKNKNGNYYDYFRDRIIFPILNPKKEVLGFGARALGDEMPKYINTSDSPIFNKGNNLYALNLLDRNQKNEKVILVEGYIDVIALYNYGVYGAVASLGTAFTPNQANLISKYTDNIYISYDGDEAGIKATKKALDVLHSMDLDAKVVELKNKMDPDNFINKFGKLSYNVELKKAKSGYGFLVDEYKKTLDLNQIEDQAKLIRYIGNTIKRIKSPIERELQMKQLSSEFEISMDSLKSEIFGNNVIIKDKKNIRKNTQNTKPLTSQDKTIIEILKLMIENKDTYDLAKDRLSVNQISNNSLKEVYLSIISSYEEEDKIDKDILIKYLTDNNIINENLTSNLLKDFYGYDSVNNLDLMNELLNRLEFTKSKMTKNQLLKKIVTLDKKPDKTDEEQKELQELMEQLMKINS